ncbi:hypothetical protein VZT92_021179 [Zoarces viviparus]|uniref:Uncharacterized protein n=1 Tax=Zoarces viviparus TaxID=48416 RepID=A0AAW1EGY2_ZOAVI
MVFGMRVVLHFLNASGRVPKTNHVENVPANLHPVGSHDINTPLVMRSGPDAVRLSIAAIPPNGFTSPHLPLNTDVISGSGVGHLDPAWPSSTSNASFARSFRHRQYNCLLSSLRLLLELLPLLTGQSLCTCRRTATEDPVRPNFRAKSEAADATASSKQLTSVTDVNGSSTVNAASLYTMARTTSSRASLTTCTGMGGGPGAINVLRSLVTSLANDCRIILCWLGLWYSSLHFVLTCSPVFPIPRLIAIPAHWGAVGMSPWARLANLSTSSFDHRASRTIRPLSRVRVLVLRPLVLCSSANRLERSGAVFTLETALPYPIWGLNPFALRVYHSIHTVMPFRKLARGDRGLCTSSRALDIMLSSLARFLRPPALLLSTFLLLCAEGPAAVLPPVGFQFEGTPFSSTNKCRGFIVRGDFSGALSPRVVTLALGPELRSGLVHTDVRPNEGARDPRRSQTLLVAVSRQKNQAQARFRGPERGPDSPSRNCLVGPTILVLPILWVITCRIPLVRTSSKSAARRQPRRPARGPRERDPTGTVAGEIREKGPARVQSRRHRPPDPIPSTRRRTPPPENLRNSNAVRHRRQRPRKMDRAPRFQWWREAGGGMTAPPAAARTQPRFAPQPDRPSP